MTRPVKIVLGCAGALAILAIVVMATGFYLVRSAFQAETVSAQQATTAFDEVRRRFPGVTPAFSFTTGGPELVRQPPATPPAASPSTVHVLVFDTSGGSLARVHIPLALLRITNAPIRFEDVTLKIEDVERYGSTVLIDGDTPDGDPILIWTD